MAPADNDATTISSTRWRRRALWIAILATIAGLIAIVTIVDRDDPADDPALVARDWRSGAWKCGDDTIRAAYELERHRPGDPSLDERLRTPQRSGCSGDPVPKIDAVLRERRGNVAVVELSHSDEPESYADPETIVLVRDDDGWKVDRERTKLSG